MMSTQTATRLTFDVSPDFFDDIKRRAVAHGTTLQNYVIDALSHYSSSSSTTVQPWNNSLSAAQQHTPESLTMPEKLLINQNNSALSEDQLYAMTASLAIKEGLASQHEAQRLLDSIG